MLFWNQSSFREAGLDELDCKILYELDCNCRQSNAAIGKKLRVNKSVVGYRIQKLLENGLKTKVPLGSIMAVASIIFFLSGFSVLDLMNSDLILRIWPKNY